MNTHTPTHRTRTEPLKYAVAWLLLSFLISCVIEWMLLSELLHGNDYFVGHLRPSSAWLNVMDGEEMVMSETLQVLPDPRHSIITVTQFVWAQVERVLPICLDAVKCSFMKALLPNHPQETINTFGKLSDVIFVFSLRNNKNNIIIIFVFQLWYLNCKKVTFFF